MNTIFCSRTIFKERRTVFSSLIVLLLFIGCSEHSNQKNDLNVQEHPKRSSNIAVLQSELELKPLEGKFFYKGIPFTGTSESYYNDGQKATETEYVQGIKNGLVKKFFENGALSFESNYVDGRQHGETKSWWRNGNQRTISNYEKGIPHGSQHQWYKSGNKFKIIHLAQGKEEGMQKSWRENGKLYNNYEAKNGRIFGLKRSQLCFKLDDENVQLSNEN